MINRFIQVVNYLQVRIMSEDEIFSCYPWIREFIAESRNIVTSRQLYTYQRCIINEMKSNRISVVNKFYSMINVEELTVDTMLSLLRLTVAWRNDTLQWAPLRDRCADELQRRGYDSQLMMGGLY
jgi:hypothetical protein